MSPLCTRLILALSLTSLAACGADDEEKTYDDFESCVGDTRQSTEFEDEAESVAVCLADHPDLHPEFGGQQECVDWVAANYSNDEAADFGCTGYFAKIDTAADDLESEGPTAPGLPPDDLGGEDGRLPR